jgi:hypothetical protein
MAEKDFQVSLPPEVVGAFWNDSEVPQRVREARHDVRDEPARPIRCCPRSWSRISLAKATSFSLLVPWKNRNASLPRPQAFAARDESIVRGRERRVRPARGSGRSQDAIQAITDSLR